MYLLLHYHAYGESSKSGLNPLLFFFLLRWSFLKLVFEHSQAAQYLIEAKVTKPEHGTLEEVIHILCKA